MQKTNKNRESKRTKETNLRVFFFFFFSLYDVHGTVVYPLQSLTPYILSTDILLPFYRS